MQNQRAFDTVFGAAATMKYNSFLPPGALQKQIVLATIKRGNRIWNYRVQSLVNAQNTLTLRYSARPESVQSARFASPFIVAVPKKPYRSVVFVENGKRVAVVTLLKPAAPRAKPVAPRARGLFEGLYRVGATTARVKPIKMAFEVRFANQRTPQIFFFDSASSRTGKPSFISEGARPQRWVFVDESFGAGSLLSANGQKSAVRRVSSVVTKPQTVKIYLVALGDEGKIGRKFGCGDSLVPVTRAISSTNAPLKSSLRELLLQPPIYAPNPKLSNFWKGRNLRIRTVSVRGGVARIHLSGEVFVAGICDQPRITQQIEATAKQFPSVKRVRVFINQQPLAWAIS